MPATIDWRKSVLVIETGHWHISNSNQRAVRLLGCSVRPEQCGNLRQAEIILCAPERRIAGIRSYIWVGSALQQHLDRVNVASHDCPKKWGHSGIVKFV